MRFARFSGLAACRVRTAPKPQPNDLPDQRTVRFSEGQQGVTQGQLQPKTSIPPSGISGCNKPAVEPPEQPGGNAGSRAGRRVSRADRNVNVAAFSARPPKNSSISSGGSWRSAAMTRKIRPPRHAAAHVRTAANEPKFRKGRPARRRTGSLSSTPGAIHSCGRGCHPPRRPLPRPRRAERSSLAQSLDGGGNRALVL